ncbi:hypothetical protein DDZ13_06290 [Coraliomargarita sinensis]|uniref:Uncharacterized protein n=1 Tax=Coraliomargarita sinensis TaxID=2174842 RepID=A0A317ZGJ9_9BACT|nr:methyltransferase domain-containing protein [Coraliomargarita sinensis]PXA04774.1 hypothetical protein DDZ13_06290 [Coraliomargarita sinensis]
MLAPKTTSGPQAISSRLVSFPGRHDLSLVGYIDEGPEEIWNGRFIILAPRYGETKKNNLKLAYSFAASGFRVLRFDQSNHIGESDGTIDNFTLPGAVEDILSAVDYVAGEFEPDELILFTVSLSARCGYRACSVDSRISRFISMVGMVDMDATLKSIYQRDIFGEFASGADWESIDILGFEINAENFHSSMCRAALIDLEGTLQDARKVEAPVLHLHAANDLWVKLEDVERVVEACPLGQLMTVPEVGHEVNENRESLQFALEKSIEFCLSGLPQSASNVALPDKESLFRQNRIERERMQKIVRFTEQESEFWETYLSKFGIIEKAHYYVEYFQQLAELLGGVKEDSVFLDAGCGNGFYGVGVIRSVLQGVNQFEGFPKAVHYCGIDLTGGGLGHTYLRHLDELSEVHLQYLSREAGIGVSYRKVDFDVVDPRTNMIIPLAEQSVDKLCCSLVVSYLKKPQALLAEFYRLLKPGGAAVVSSMKPGCDLTVLYHDSLARNYSDSNQEQATELLSSAGRIKTKQEVGVYKFYEAAELERLAFDAGFTDIKSMSCFGNQANLIRISK